MSARMATTIRCDAKGCINAFEMEGGSIRATRERAITNRWFVERTVVGDTLTVRDFCPGHARGRR